jgi:teichoic acid transport system ATP-binding protein
VSETTPAAQQVAPERPAPAAPRDVSRAPLTVVVDDLHVSYRVFATGKGMSTQKRLLRRTPGVRRSREVKALRGVSFVAHEGEAIGVVGRNGSGKSTLLRAIAGLTPPSQGTIYADGHPALLGVNAALINELSGERNVVLGGLALGMSPDEVKAQFESVVDFAGIGQFIELPMSTYSQGMGARLRFAIASSTTQRILLIDEALAVGDADFQRKSEARINDLRAKAGTVFLVSHSLGSIAQTCDRTLWIDAGLLRMDGPTKDVLAAYSSSI